MSTQEPQPSETTERQQSPQRVLAITALIVVLVGLGYATLLFLAGNALQDAPFARQILGVRERLRALTTVEPPRALPPILQPEEGIQVSPSPVVASPVPSPTLSPTFVPPSPDAPTSLTFTINYLNNTGVRLTGVRLTNDLPPGTSLVTGSPSPPASFDGTTLVWNIGTLDPGVGGKVSFRVVTRRTGRITNTAVMTSNETEPTSITSSATIS